MQSLVVLDTSYDGIAEEQAGAGPFRVSISDGRSPTAPGDAADGALIQYASIGPSEMDANPGWKVLGRYGVGTDTIDIPAATERGIAVFNVPDYCTREVATHAAALTLARLRALPEADQLVRSGKWPEWASLPLLRDPGELVLGVVGAGAIGQEYARLMGPSFRRVVGYDPSGVKGDTMLEVDLGTLLATADVVSLHCPLTPQTRHLLDAPRLGTMRQGVVIINVSRGGLVDSAALAAALHSGHVGGAALDVLDEEPPAPDNPLLSAPRTMFSNHVAWLSEGSQPRLRRMLAQRCASYLAGEPIAAPVNHQSLALAAVSDPLSPSPSRSTTP